MAAGRGVFLVLATAIAAGCAYSKMDTGLGPKPQSSDGGSAGASGEAGTGGDSGEAGTEHQDGAGGSTEAGGAGAEAGGQAGSSAGEAGVPAGGDGLGGSAGQAGVTNRGGTGTEDGGTSPAGGTQGQSGSANGGRESGGGNAGGAATGGQENPSGGQGAGGANGGTAGTAGTLSGGTAGSGGALVGDKTPGTPQAGDIIIDPATSYQTMDGFGIADIWQGQSTSSAEQRTLFWDPDQGIGMSILRIGIDETGQIMGDAGFVEGPVVSGFGGKVWAAPFSPPANLKDNNDVNNGGHLNTSAYDTWASTLAAFPAYYKQNTGDDLWGISAQTEPDYVTTYQSCIYSATQMNDFIKVLGPKLKALDPPVHLLAAEASLWSHTWTNGDRYGVAIEGDATVSELVDVIATHDYDGDVQSTTRPSPPGTMTHHLWMTEVSYTPGAAILPGLDIARGIYAAVTSGGVSGWVYWWTPSFLDGGSTSDPPKRVYAMGNYSKFVRPGYLRVDISGVPSAVQIVPFMNPLDGTFAIVAQNDGSSAESVTFFVSGPGWPGTITPYITSTGSNLDPDAPITAVAGRFSATLEAQSVTTFVGVQ